MKPSPAAVAQAFKSMKPHVPLIRFRKGSGGSSHAVAGHSVPSSAPAMMGGGAMRNATPLKPNQAYQLPVIEDWQLPARFRRRELDQDEIDFINRGGPEEPSAKPAAKPVKK